MLFLELDYQIQLIFRTNVKFVTMIPMEVLIIYQILVISAVPKGITSQTMHVLLLQLYQQIV